MRSITVIGEALIDIVHEDGTVREIPGGSPANVALGLGRLGVPVEFVTRLGRDARGQLISFHLRGAGVSLAPGSDQGHRSSTAQVRLDAAGHPGYHFDIDWDMPRGAAPASRCVHIGSTAAFLAPGAAKVCETAERVAACGGLVSFDPNIRPALLPDHAGSRAWFKRLAASTAVLKMSDEDAQWLYPDMAHDAVLDRLHALGVRLAVITRGSGGARLSTRDARLDVAASPATVVDTVGAGDTYVATMLWQLLEAPAEWAGPGDPSGWRASMGCAREPPRSRLAERAPTFPRSMTWSR